MNKYWTHFPIYLSLVYFPIASLILKFFGIGINYDVIWIIVFGFFLLFKRHKIRVTSLFFVLLLLFLVKYLSPFYFYNVNLKALVMDGKYLFYIVFVLLWVDEFKNISVESTYKSILFFSKLYIVYTIVRLIFLPGIDRDGILMEANYDGFMILLGVCIMDVSCGKKKDLIIMVLATFCTLSRTGIICLLVLLAYRIIKHNFYIIIPAIPVLLLAIWIAVSIRGEESVEHLDRFVFFEQAFVYFNNIDISTLLLGSSPGVSLKMDVIPTFEWYIGHFEEGKGLIGIYPFYFHSTYLRIAFTWGIIGVVVFVIFLLRKIVYSKLDSTRYFFILVFIQSISLSTLTIPNLSILVFIIFFLLMKEERKVFCVTK